LIKNYTKLSIKERIICPCFWPGGQINCFCYNYSSVIIAVLFYIFLYTNTRKIPMNKLLCLSLLSLFCHSLIFTDSQRTRDEAREFTKEVNQIREKIDYTVLVGQRAVEKKLSKYEEAKINNRGGYVERADALTAARETDCDFVYDATELFLQVMDSWYSYLDSHYGNSREKQGQIHNARSGLSNAFGKCSESRQKQAGLAVEKGSVLK